MKKLFGNNLIEDHTNKVYNYITCMSFTKINNGRTMWLGKCECGTIKEFAVSQLISGKTKSCGCKKSKIIKDKRTLPGNEANINFLIRRLKYQAKDRNLDFQLSNDVILKLSKGNCTYCNKPPTAKTQYKSNHPNVYLYNGIDRVDSSIGYIESNCVSCCKRCNSAKNDLSVEEFKEHIKTIYTFLKL